MLADLVLDTNVLAHSQNPEEKRFRDSLGLLTGLLDCTTELCVDEGFDVDPTANRSAIGSEYQRHIQFGSVAFAVIAHLARVARIRERPRRPPMREAKRINQLLRNRVDRTFLGVAVNSEEQVLVSHDFIDFQKAKRKTILKELGVRVIEACECRDELS